MDGLPVLPEGVTRADWALEQIRLQNPLIRAILACLNQVEEVAESDYHLMHCSPDRLNEIWDRVRELVEAIRSQLPPTLDGRSSIPELEAIRESTRLALAELERDLFSRMDALAAEPFYPPILELRRLLCVAFGALQTFLYTAFGEIMGADPRSSHDADYYMSRRVPREIQESEWLRENVVRLDALVHTLEEDRKRLLEPMRVQLKEVGRVPDRGSWSELSMFLLCLYNDLPLQLKEILCLPGIRFEEMESLHRFSLEIPTRCLSLFEVYGLCSEILGTGDGAGQGPHAIEARHRAALTSSLARLVNDMNSWLKNLERFVATWLHDIDRRRALVFTSRDDEPEGSGDERAPARRRPR